MSDLERELDRLYARPLAEFIGARNELAKTLRSAGDRQAADEVKALVKPSLPAWAVNALYHHERARFDDLLEAAVAVRQALAGKGDRRTAEAARRKALLALLGRAAKLLAGAGHAATPANRQRVGQTLEALAAHDPAADGPQPGRLSAELEPQGFDVLASLAASLAPAAPAGGPAKRPTKRAAKRAGGKAAAATAAAALEQGLTAARRKVVEHESVLDRLTREAAQAEQRARLAGEAAADAKKEVAAAKAAATKAKAARRQAAARLATARRQLERRLG